MVFRATPIYHFHNHCAGGQNAFLAVEDGPEVVSRPRGVRAVTRLTVLEPSSNAKKLLGPTCAHKKEDAYVNHYSTEAVP